jgi:hypothetical protein
MCQDVPHSTPSGCRARRTLGPFAHFRSLWARQSDRAVPRLDAEQTRCGRFAWSLGTTSNYDSDSDISVSA